MIKRGKHLGFKRMRYNFWEPTILQTKLTKSFLKNFDILPINRLSWIFQKRYTNKSHTFYWSQNKLQCPFSFSFSVPNKRIQHSRFYLNKALDRLMHGGYQKYSGLLFFTKTWKG